jgi:uncharacterized protein (TIGR00730 family)
MYYHQARELSAELARWSTTLRKEQRFVICSGGGGGIMEAANRGADDAGCPSIGLNISLPHEQQANSYISKDLGFQFHYFFMRKLWFTHLARAVVVFPGGFGTLDELTDILTLIQTGKISRQTLVVIYGSSYWREIINFDRLVETGMIAPEDLSRLHFVDQVDDALKLLKSRLAE